MKHIVHIYGPCGSGTSTLGREIGRRLGFRFLDTDDFFWLPTAPRTPRSAPWRSAWPCWRRSWTSQGTWCSPGR